MSSAELGEILSLVMFAGVFLILMAGYPVAFSLAGAAIGFALLGSLLGAFDWIMMAGVMGRIFDAMVNETLVAVPLFVFMGVMLERSRLAEDLLVTMGQLFGDHHGGIGISVVLVGTLLAASTGIVGATVVTMGLISLPAMTKAKYDPKLSAGIICASGTLSQLIPPSTVLILIGGMLQGANTQANLALGNFTAPPVTVTDLFSGALLPGLVLVSFYMGWMILLAIFRPASCPPLTMAADERASLWGRVLWVMLPPLLLILAVLGSILSGIATATESAAVGALGATLLAALRGQLSRGVVMGVARSTLDISTMIFVILIGATVFSLVFRGLGGEKIAHDVLSGIPGGAAGATLVVLALMFFLGFFIDTFEIIFIVVPIFAPVLIMLGTDPIWLGVAMGMVLQTSYLTPPFGFALFYLQGVTRELPASTIYRGVAPFVVMQLGAIAIVWAFPGLATWLPKVLF